MRGVQLRRHKNRNRIIVDVATQAQCSLLSARWAAARRAGLFNASDEHYRCLQMYILNYFKSVLKFISNEKWPPEIALRLCF